MNAAFNTLYKPIFFDEVPSLQNIVICKIIQQSWHNELSIQKFQDKLTTFLKRCKFLQATLDLKYQKIELLWNVPWEKTQMSSYLFEETILLSEQSKIQRIMELYALNLITEFTDWIHYNTINIFCDGGSLFLGADSTFYPIFKSSSSFEEFVYDVYGRIDYKKTARNLLICADVTPYQKFCIACQFCFEKEIEQLWPSIQTQLALHESELIYHGMLQYWIPRMTNKLNPIFFPSMMFSHAMTYSAMKYFWKDIRTFDEKVKSIGLCFERANPIGEKLCVDHWFPKMNNEFLKCLISRYGIIIMVELIQSPLCRKFMLSFWQHTGDLFDGDQFVKILERMNAQIFRDFRLICGILWRNAPIKLKIHALNHYQIEDSFDPFNYLIKKIYAVNPFSLNYEWGVLSIVSPYDCFCGNGPEEEDCKCFTLLK